MLYFADTLALFLLESSRAVENVLEVHANN